MGELSQLPPPPRRWETLLWCCCRLLCCCGLMLGYNSGCGGGGGPVDVVVERWPLLCSTQLIVLPLVLHQHPEFARHCWSWGPGAALHRHSRESEARYQRSYQAHINNTASAVKIQQWDSVVRRLIRKRPWAWRQCWGWQWLFSPSPGTG